MNIQSNDFCSPNCCDWKPNQIIRIKQLTLAWLSTVSREQKQKKCQKKCFDETNINMKIRLTSLRQFSVYCWLNSLLILLMRRYAIIILGLFVQVKRSKLKLNILNSSNYWIHSILEKYAEQNKRTIRTNIEHGKLVNFINLFVCLFFVFLLLDSISRWECNSLLKMFKPKMSYICVCVSIVCLHAC